MVRAEGQYYSHYFSAWAPALLSKTVPQIARQQYRLDSYLFTQDAR